MIRVFDLFCKLNFINISEIDFFNQSRTKINVNDHICPLCKTKHPNWSRHAVYQRYLVSFEHGNTISHIVTIERYKCSSCGHTHAILPESLIPYQSYSFLFIIAVLRDYFTKSLTIERICEKYNISISTLYAWKNLFIRNKKIWLGLLKDSYTSPVQFLNSLFSANFLYNLKDFFYLTGFSFLQSMSLKKAHSIPK